METQAPSTTTWVIDPMHSEVQFKVKHLMVSTVSGQFSQFDGQLTMTGDDFEAANITFSADIDSISTGNEQRVTLKAEYGGQMQDFYGNTKAGFEVTGTIKRKEFGLTWDGVTEAGGVVVSDDVKLVMNIQVAKQA